MSQQRCPGLKNALSMTARSISAPYPNVMTSDALVTILRTGDVPAEFAPHVIRFLDETPPQMVRAAIEDAASADVPVETIKAQLQAWAMKFNSGIDELLVEAAFSRQPSYKSPLVPLYLVDEAGVATQIAEINLLDRDGCAVLFGRQFEWPFSGSGPHCTYPGIPYFLEDMRPQGFLGRQFAQRHASSMQLPEAPNEWSDADIWAALTSKGADQVGNLIVGEAAYRQFLLSAQQDVHVYRADEVDSVYPFLAGQAMAGAANGPLVGGEFPKFTAARLIDGEPQHVIVKFTADDDTQRSRRWSDLLVCEHIASNVLRDQLGIDAARSRICQAAGRTFLEVVRFDRHGAFGRSPVCSWASLNAGLIGLAGDPWPKGATKLHQAGWLNTDAVATVEKIWHFGRLISNTDMHDGNLSFVPGLAVAPVYDMLPMAYSPQRDGGLVDREYLPQLPLASERQAWKASADAAIKFWRRASTDERIGSSFRSICRTNCERLADVLADRS